MRTGTIENVVLKGANAYSEGYITDTTLEALSGYKEFEGLYVLEQPILVAETKQETSASGYVSSVRNYRLSFKLACVFQPYPTTALNVREYLIDNSNNKLIDVLNCRYHWIQSSGTHKYEFVPNTEASYASKNLSIGIDPTFEQNNGHVRVILNCLSTVYV